jgi:hypothetical protein
MHSSLGTPTASTMGAWHASVRHTYSRAPLPRPPPRAARDAHDHQGVNLRAHMAGPQNPRHWDAGASPMPCRMLGCQGALQRRRNPTLTLAGSRAAHLVADANLKPLFTPGLSRCSTGAPRTGRGQWVPRIPHSTSPKPALLTSATRPQHLAPPTRRCCAQRICYEECATLRSHHARQTCTESLERKGAGPVAGGARTQGLNGPLPQLGKERLPRARTPRFTQAPRHPCQ